jgi:hypothetical protein
MVSRSFLTSHPRVLLCIARDPACGCATSRPAWASPNAAPTASSAISPAPATSSSGKTAGVTRYQIQAHLPLAAGPGEAAIGEVLALLAGTPPGWVPDGPGQ